MSARRTELDIPKLRELFKDLTHEQRVEFTKKHLTAAQRKVLEYESDLWLRDNQLVPTDGFWRYYLILAGRFFGKTKAGACWIKRCVRSGAKSLGIVGPTHKDVSQVMVPAIQAEFPLAEKPEYSEKAGTLTFKTGAICYCYSSETEIRGPNLEKLWADELVKWCDGLPDKVRETFDVLDFAVRIGGNPQILVTTSPKPWTILKDWEKQAEDPDSLVRIVRGKSRENTAIAESTFLALEKKFKRSRMGRQELEGEILTDNPGALWSYEMFSGTPDEPLRVKLQWGPDGRLVSPSLIRIVVAVDPAVTDGKNSDLTGIVVVGLGEDGHVYVLDDASGRYSPEQWARKVVDRYHFWKADRIVAEKNNGGKLVEINIRTAAPHLPIKLVDAKSGKLTRAEPVAGLYEQKLVHHCGEFRELEDQCCEYTGDPRQKSPDRLDALVYGITELKLGKHYVIRDLTYLPQF